MKAWIVAGVLAAVPAAAQTTIVRGDDREVYAEKTIIDATGVELTGDPVKPAGQFIVGKHHARFASHIRLRAHFQPELAASVDKL